MLRRYIHNCHGHEYCSRRTAVGRQARNDNNVRILPYLGRVIERFYCILDGFSKDLYVFRGYLAVKCFTVINIFPQSDIVGVLSPDPNGGLGGRCNEIR